jgi:hypothetical protein
MDIGTKIIIWPPIFMVRSCTVFPLGVWTDIIFGFDVFASEVIGASRAAAVSKESESLRTRIFTSLVTFLITRMQ